MCLHSSHKLGWESSLFPATDESQVSNKRWGIQKLSWPSLQVKDLSKAISGNRFFARTDRCACLGWACHDNAWSETRACLVLQNKCKLMKNACRRHTFAGTRAHCFAVPSFIITHHGPSLQSAGNAANSNSCRVPGACSYDLGCNISFSRERQMLTHSTWMGKQPVSGNR
jgi:hypothetical protein